MSTTPEDLNPMLILIGKRMVVALTILLTSILVIAIISKLQPAIPLVSLLVVCVGIVGGFVGLQRRLKQLSPADLNLLSESYIYSFLAPLIGGVLALLLYILFISGLLAGDLFPKFDPDGAPNPSSFASLFYIHGDAKAYAKLIFWCFVAGFSERFVTDIIGGFEKRGNK
jgi:hypothetical protein